MVNVTKKTKKKPTESPEFVQLLKKMFFFLCCRKENSFFDEMSNFVNQTFGNGKADVSGSLVCVYTQCSIFILFPPSLYKPIGS